MTTIQFADGPLFFPVTPFDTDGAVDHGLLREHVSRGVAATPGGIFPACGTGEFHALSVTEALDVVGTTVDAVSGAVPVIAGVGGPVGQAVESMKAVADAGADGVLLLPPYLVGGTTEGLVRYVEAVAAAAPLSVIVYHRGTAKFDAASFARIVANNPNVVGFKDGIGDIALAQQIVLEARAVRDDLLFFNGLLTAEASQAAYRAIGIPLYSSAVFAMAPEIARAFYTAYWADDTAAREELLAKFYLPLVRLRDTTPGYAVSLIKAGLRQGGLAVGSVRAPLVDPTAEHDARLAELLAIGRELVSA